MKPTLSVSGGDPKAHDEPDERCANACPDPISHVIVS
jgi:hypothetical protein